MSDPNLDFLRELHTREDFKTEFALQSITNSIRERLAVLDMTQQKLAELAGVTPANISRMLGGSNNFTVKTLFKVAHVLNASWVFQLIDDADMIEEDDKPVLALFSPPSGKPVYQSSVSLADDVAPDIPEKSTSWALAAG